MAIFSCVSTHSGLHYVVVADRVLRGYISEWNAPDSNQNAVSAFEGGYLYNAEKIRVAQLN